jgi:hypothetical protein
MTILILLSALAALVLLGATAAFAVAARRRVLAPFRSWVTARSVSFRCTVARHDSCGDILGCVCRCHDLAIRNALQLRAIPIPKSDVTEC